MSVSIGSDLPGRMARAASELKCLERLSRAPTPEGPHELCRNLHTMVEDLKSIHTSVTLSLDCRLTSLGPKLSDEAATIMLVVTELVENAIDALKNKGGIQISVGPLPSIGAIQISVRDDGPGVPKRIRDSVFHAGVSTKGEGRGIGLALVSDSVRSVGGEITYKYDGASTFRVILPEQ